MEDLLKKLKSRFEAEFEEKIVKKLTPEENKATTVFLAGQPGSGKSKLSGFVENEFFKGNIYVLDIDELRKLHPLYKKMIKNDPKNLYSLDKDLRLFRQELVNKLHKHKYNYIIDGTLGGNYDYIRFDAINARKYNNVQLNVLSVNEVVSKLGFVFRFEQNFKNKGYGRNVDFSYHNQIYKNIPENIKSLINDKLLDSINVFAKNINRKHTLYYAHFGKNSIIDALVVYKKLRNISFQKEELISLKNWTNSIKKLIKERNGNIKPFLNKLKKQAVNNSSIKKQLNYIANNNIKKGKKI